METDLREDVRVFKSADLLAQAAAELFREASEQAIADNGSFHVALSGGETPQLLFRTLGIRYRKKIAWDKTHLFWVDERCVPRNHEQSNFRLAYDELISSIWIPYEHVHRVKAELRPEEAARYYESELKKYFKEDIPVFDLVLLGVGTDGHTASLFPKSPGLTEKLRLVLPVFSHTALHWRVTLTLPVLNNAKQAVFLVSGRSKAEIAAAVLGGEWTSCPAGLVKPLQGRLIWLLDADAASGLRP